MSDDVPLIMDVRESSTFARRPITDDLESSRTPRRRMCTRCEFPARTCLCEALPSEPIQLTRCKVHVLQHPLEVKRKNRSLPLVQHCLAPIEVVTGRRLSINDTYFIELHPILLQSDTPVWLVFPGDDAVPLEEALDDFRVRHRDNAHPPTIHVFFLDATWKYAVEIHRANHFPSHAMCVQLTNVSSGRFSECRTPPGPHCWSTAECMAHVVSRIENRSDIWDTVLKPVDLMAEQWRNFRLENEAKQQSST